MLPYDPGVLPTRPAPEAGEKLCIKVPGMPPAKDRRRSIRNRNHPLHASFIELRKAAIREMAGRAWSFRPVELHLVVRSPNELHWYTLNDYLGGVMDTLDGSSGYTFTYLPIVFEDDSQVTNCTIHWEHSDETEYELVVSFR